MLSWVVNSRHHSRRSFPFRRCHKKLVTRRNSRLFFSYSSGLFHFPYPLSPFLATHTKSAGVYPNNSHSGTQRSHTASLPSSHRPLPTSSPFPSYSCALLCTFLHLPKTQLICFHAIPHSLQKNARGGGYPRGIPSFTEAQNEVHRRRDEPDRQLVTPYSSPLPVTSTLVAALQPKCYDLVFHDPC
jgi:hypothetical protein